jgi:hypothetical protein
MLVQGSASEHNRLLLVLASNLVRSICCTRAAGRRARRRGDFGRLGHGECVDVFIPRAIDALRGRAIVRVACGDTHTLAVTEGGELYSFGRNTNGQLGHGNTDDSLVPRLIEALKVRTGGLFRQLLWRGCGEHCLPHALPVSCQRPEARLSVCEVKTGPRACATQNSQLSKSYPHTGCLLRRSPQSTRCHAWPHLQVSVALQLVCLTACQPACSPARAWPPRDCRPAARAWCAAGPAGAARACRRVGPRLRACAGGGAAPQGQPVSSVAAGGEHAIAALLSGGAVSWGWGRYGNLGDGTRVDRTLPTQVPRPPRPLPAPPAPSPGPPSPPQGSSLPPGANTHANQVLGRPNSLFPLMLGHPSAGAPGAWQGQAVACIAAGAEHSAASTAAGTVFTWGWGRYGCLGDGAREDRWAPVQV